MHLLRKIPFPDLSLRSENGIIHAICLYFSRVANPPRICRSDLLTSSTCRACLASVGSICMSRSVTSLCTVLFDTPNALAVCRTVALDSIRHCSVFLFCYDDLHTLFADGGKLVIHTVPVCNQAVEGFHITDLHKRIHANFRSGKQ